MTEYKICIIIICLIEQLMNEMLDLPQYQMIVHLQMECLSLIVTIITIIYSAIIYI